MTELAVAIGLEAVADFLDGLERRGHVHLARGELIGVVVVCAIVLDRNEGFRGRD